MGPLAQSSLSEFCPCSTHTSVVTAVKRSRDKKAPTPTLLLPLLRHMGTNHQPKSGVNLSNYKPQSELKQLFSSHKLNESKFLNPEKQFKQ